MTGADVTGHLPQDINWAALADPQVTTVVFMGQRSFPELAKGLRVHGLPGTTPALFDFITKQRLLRTDIDSLARIMARKKVPQPGLILYGPLAFGRPAANAPSPRT